MKQRMASKRRYIGSTRSIPEIDGRRIPREVQTFIVGSYLPTEQLVANAHLGRDWLQLLLDETSKRSVEETLEEIIRIEDLPLLRIVLDTFPDANVGWVSLLMEAVEEDLQDQRIIAEIVQRHPEEFREYLNGLRYANTLLYYLLSIPETFELFSDLFLDRHLTIHADEILIDNYSIFTKILDNYQSKYGKVPDEVLHLVIKANDHILGLYKNPEGRELVQRLLDATTPYKR